MKTAVSIPDELFVKADELARRLGKSRSEVYREALADYLARREPGAIKRALDAIVDELAADHEGFVDVAARQTLERSEWRSARATSAGRRSTLPLGQVPAFAGRS